MIITQDKQKNLLCGDIVVKDREILKEIRDCLIQNRADLPNYKISTEELAGFRSLLDVGFLREDNHLIHKYITAQYDDDCYYTREVIHCVHLNSILLFTSLLGELDATHYDSLGQQFIAKGIIKCVPFEQLWLECFQNMVAYYSEPIINKIRLQDLKAFRKVLALGVIDYEVSQQISPLEMKRQVIKGLTSADLSQLEVNNAVILGDNRIFEKRRKKLIFRNYF